MAIESVATLPVSQAGTEHDLWVGGRNVLSIRLDLGSKHFPPAPHHCADINQMIQGLARSAKAVVFQAENETDGVETSFLLQPLDDIADAIILLSQLSEAVRSETAKIGG